MTVDVHAHFWPDGLLSAAWRGDSWYGWTPSVLPGGTLGVALGSRVVPFPVPRADLADPSARAQRRRERGVTVEAIMQVGFLWNQHLEGHEAVRHCREVNDELAVVQERDAGAVWALGALPFHEPRLFESELARLVALGIGGVALPASVRGENLDAPRIMAMIESVVDAELAMVLHPTYLTPPGAERMPRHYFVNSIGASLECTLALMSLIHGGLFDRRPDVRLVVVQGGGSVPYEIGRFSLRYRERADLRTMDRPPETYLRCAHYDCMVADADSLAFLVARVGADRVLVGTDHPFRSDVPGGAAAWVAGHPGLSLDEKAAISHGNARRLLSL